ncbi:MAG: DUF4368 domain-containing protein [Oscillospiraceae bacterium]|nr:DUF4368 domain-containing protein [Oscillospiraceae bacterium]
MQQLNACPSVGIAAPYQSIPDFQPGMSLPDKISVLYARLSNDDKQKNKGKNKEDDSDSIVNQKKMLAKHATDNRLINPVFFIDDGISGTTFNRPDFQAALELVEAGRVVNFAVKDLSRFGRYNALVGYYTDYVFPEMDVRFIAINDDVDDTTGESEITTQIKNIFNEYYPRETSKKVRKVFEMKGMAGERLCFKPIYGYRKDPDNSKLWIIDEEAAQVVRQIFQWCMEGLGPTHIANRLREAKILIPFHYAHHAGICVRKRLSDDPYGWTSGTVADILERREYLGHTVNFKSSSKSFRNKKRIYADPSDCVVFENTHPRIVEDEVFDRVQQIRSGKRRKTKSGRICLFSGSVYCVDCGGKMHFSCGSSLIPERDWYTCSNFRSKKKPCHSAHYIRRVVLEQMVLEHIQKVTAYAAENEKDLAQRLQQNDTDKLKKEMAADNKNLLLSQKRVQELDAIIQSLYEDKVKGGLSPERFARLSQGYEQEQKELELKVKTLQAQLSRQKEERMNVERFLKQVRKYTRVTELTPTMLHELVERVEVCAPDKINGKRIQQIKISYNYVGNLDRLELPPIPPPKEIPKISAENA